jgi:hypothetical protein
METSVTSSGVRSISASASITAFSWPRPPSIRTRSGQLAGLPSSRLLLASAIEAAAHHFAHHAVIVAGLDRDILDVELAIGAFHEAFRPRHHHAAHSIRALDVGVVVDLDPGRRLFQFEHFRHFLQQPRLARRLGQFPRSRASRALRAACADEIALAAALRPADLHLAIGLQAQRLGDQRACSGMSLRRGSAAAAGACHRTAQGRRSALPHRRLIAFMARIVRRSRPSSGRRG